MTEAEHLRGGDLNLAVTSALVGIHARHLGQGPKTASTFYHDNVVVTLMHDVLTKAEKILAQTGRHAEVSEARRLFQQTMEAELCAAVEKLTGHKVLACLSALHIPCDVVSQTFLLDGRL